MSIEKLIEEERKSIKMVEEAKAEAEKIITDAKKEGQKIIDQAVSKEYIEEYLAKEEKNAMKEAGKIKDKYKKEASRIKEISPGKIQKTSNLVLNEVLKFD
jgi:vacuolar-type H+-ATPase subunit H